MLNTYRMKKILHYVQDDKKKNTSFGLSGLSQKFRLFATPYKNDLVAQLVEQLTLNQWVESSSLSQVTIFKNRFIVFKGGFLFFS
jgi:hypothetical protein